MSRYPTTYLESLVLFAPAPSECRIIAGDVEHSANRESLSLLIGHRFPTGFAETTSSSIYICFRWPFLFEGSPVGVFSTGLRGTHL